MMEITKPNKITRKIFNRFFWPGVISSAGLSVANIADALVVGTKMGETGLAAISIVLPVFMLYNIVGFGMSVGGSTHYSNLLTGGKAGAAVDHFNRILRSSLVISAIIAALGNIFMPQLLYVLGAKDTGSELYAMAESYGRITLAFAPLFMLNFIMCDFLRNDDRQNIATLGFVVNCVCDLTLNIVFVLVLDFGVAGAIWATVIAQTVMAAIYVPQIFVVSSILRIRWASFNAAEVWKSFLNGFGSSVQYGFQFVFILLTNRLLMDMSGELGVAVFDVTLNVSYIAYIFFSASVGALIPMVSTFAGERDETSVKDTLRLATVYGMVSNTLLAVLIAIFAPQLCSLFGLSGAEVNSIGAFAVRFYCISVPFAGISMLGCAYMQTLEKSVAALMIVSLRTFIILIPAVLIFSLTNLGMFFLSFAVTEIISLCVWAPILYSRRHNLKIYGGGSADIYVHQLEPTQDDIGELMGGIEEYCEEKGASVKQQYYVNMVVEEIVAAIKDYAFKGDDGYIRLTLFVNEDGDFELHIRDSARAFNPFDMKTGKLKSNVEDDELTKGIGILMVKKKAKNFFYRNYQGFNSLIVKI